MTSRKDANADDDTPERTEAGALEGRAVPEYLHHSDDEARRAKSRAEAALERYGI